MSMISTRCSSCGFQGKVPGEFVGKKVKCRQCGQLFTIAAADEPAGSVDLDDRPPPGRASADLDDRPAPGRAPAKPRRKLAALLVLLLFLLVAGGAGAGIWLVAGDKLRQKGEPVVQADTNRTSPPVTEPTKTQSKQDTQPDTKATTAVDTKVKAATDTKVKAGPDTKSKAGPDTKAKATKADELGFVEDPKLVNPKPAVKPDDPAVLPMITRSSTDPTLPGTWYIVDRTKPIRKMVDRPSLVPTAARQLVLFDVTQVGQVDKTVQTVFAPFALPADIGDEQTLLGCLPRVTDKDGKDLKFDIGFYQGLGPGSRYAEVVVPNCPPDTPITISICCAVLNPPVLNEMELAAQTRGLKYRQTKPLSGEGKPGFPKPEFTSGGPGYVGAVPGQGTFETISNVLEATGKLVEVDLQQAGTDPDAAKKNRKANYEGRARVAEKGLASVARSSFVVALNQRLVTTGGRYALLLVEDPETGSYFLADPNNPTYMGPHPGDIFITAGLNNQGFPTAFNMKDYTRTSCSGSFGATGSATLLKPLVLSGSSLAGDNKAKFQAWLQKAPAEMRETADKMVKAEGKPAAKVQVTEARPVNPTDTKLQPTAILPTIDKPSTDPSLVGTWFIVDRSKPIIKLVDRPSLMATGATRLEIFDFTQVVSFEKPAAKTNLLIALPVDIGEDQVFLGCLPFARTSEGKGIQYAVDFYQSRSGARYMEMVLLDAPDGTPITVTIKCAVLVPPKLSDGDCTGSTKLLASRESKAGNRPSSPGFPEADFLSGGPAYLGVTPDSNPFQTIANVLEKTASTISYQAGLPPSGFDPDRVKADAKGNSEGRARVAEKALFGVARAGYLGGYDQRLPNLVGGRHGLLVVEDPESGAYFFADPSAKPAYMGGHRGNFVAVGGLNCEGLPDPNGLKFDPHKSPFGMSRFSVPTKEIMALSLVGSSVDGAEAEKYQAWIRRVPVELTDQEKKLAKKDTRPVAVTGTTPQVKPAEPTTVPVTTRPSTDLTLPGTWYLLDRTKPIQKFVDRPSLLPTGVRNLVMLEMARTLNFKGTLPPILAISAYLPVDIGEEQVLLGYLPSVTNDKGAAVPFTVAGFRATKEGTRWIQLEIDNPKDKSLTVSMKFVLQQAPHLSMAQTQEATKKVLKTPGKSKPDPKRNVGFPEPEFKEGGPAFIGAKEGKSTFETINNVLQATDKEVRHPGQDGKRIADLKFEELKELNTLDPDAAKKNKKGFCPTRVRVAEKSLAGVARAVIVFGGSTIAEIVKGKGSEHAMLLIEEPETGAYLFADMQDPPVMGPHRGSFYVFGGLTEPILKKQTGCMGIEAKGSDSSDVAYWDSLLGPGKKKEQLQTWLKSLSGDFREMQTKLAGDFLPVYPRPSTDSTLPGTWYMIDRNKPIAKLVDRPSLTPAGTRSLVLMDYSRVLQFGTAQSELMVLLPLPADVGNEQVLLGFLPSVAGNDGKALRFDARFFQAKGQVGMRFVELIVPECPKDVPVIFSVKSVLLLPAAQTKAQQSSATQAFLKRKKIDKLAEPKPGFPEPEFKTGGPEFIKATAGQTPYQTIGNVLKTVHSQHKQDGSPLQPIDLDPEIAKFQQLANCTGAMRVAEKSLAGVAKARFIVIERELTDRESINVLAAKIANKEEKARFLAYPNVPYAMLIVEDPQTGGYFLAGTTEHVPAYMGPHTGNMVIMNGILTNDSIPDALCAKSFPKPKQALDYPYFMASSAQQLKSQIKPAFVGSSRAGKEAAKYQAWLKSAPAEFRELEQKANQTASSKP